VRVGAALLVTICLAPACGSSTTAPSGAAVPGVLATVYTGSMHDSQYGDGTLRASMNTVAGLTTGTFTMSFAGARDVTVFSSGVISNTGAYEANLTSCTGDVSCMTGCTFLLDSMFTSTGLSGTYTTIVTPSCSIARTGTIALVRQ
jgi:hypothetical protein